MTTRVEVYCRDCQQTGKHSETCPVRDFLPPICCTDENSLIVSVTTNSGNSIKGENKNQPESFFTPDLPAFRHGRSLTNSATTGLQWFRFNDEFESMLQKEHAPSGGSTQASTSAHQFSETPRYHSTPFAARLQNIAEGRDNEPRWGQGGSYNPNQSMLDMTALTESVIEGFCSSQMALEMVSSIPHFNGDKKNFDPWCEKVKQVRGCMPDNKLLKFLHLKLEGPPLQHLQSCTDWPMSIDRTLDELRNHYDMYATPIDQNVAFQDLWQGDNTIQTHHTEVNRILRAMKESVGTRSDSIRTYYARSVSNPALSKRLVRILIQVPNTTLGEMMKISTDFARIDSIHNHMRDHDSAKTIASVQVNALKQGGKSEHRREDRNPYPQKRSRPDSSGHRPSGNREPLPPRDGNGEDKWCAIHQTNSHFTERCYLRNHEQCKFCKQFVGQGNFAKHVDSGQCQGAKCSTCGKMGHVARFCKANDNFRHDNQGPSNHRGNYQHRPQATAPPSNPPAPVAPSTYQTPSSYQVPNNPPRTVPVAAASVATPPEIINVVTTPSVSTGTSTDNCVNSQS